MISIIFVELFFNLMDLSNMNSQQQSSTATLCDKNHMMSIRSLLERYGLEDTSYIYHEKNSHAIPICFWKLIGIKK